MSSSTLATTAIMALEPYVGRMAAETCIRATALSTGKTSDDLSLSDLPSVEANIRRLLRPVAPVATIDAILHQIEQVAA